MARLSYQIKFLEYNGNGPWPCFFCSEEIELDEKFVIHHVDGEHSNEAQENLVPAHRSCHTSHHLKGNQRTKGRVQSPEERDRRRQSLLRLRDAGFRIGRPPKKELT